MWRWQAGADELPHRGCLKADWGVGGSQKTSGDDDGFGFIYTVRWGFYSPGKCAVRTQCSGSSRDPWDYGSLLTSSGTADHYSSRFNLESALQVYYYTEVMTVNLDCGLRQAVGLLVIYISLGDVSIYETYKHENNLGDSPVQFFFRENSW